jgi:hypothetical protein
LRQTSKPATVSIIVNNGIIIKVGNSGTVGVDEGETVSDAVGIGVVEADDKEDDEC